LPTKERKTPERERRGGEKEIGCISHAELVRPILWGEEKRKNKGEKKRSTGIIITEFHFMMLSHIYHLTKTRGEPSAARERRRKKGKKNSVSTHCANPAFHVNNLIFKPSTPYLGKKLTSRGGGEERGEAPQSSILLNFS